MQYLKFLLITTLIGELALVAWLTIDYLKIICHGKNIRKNSERRLFENRCRLYSDSQPKTIYPERSANQVL